MKEFAKYFDWPESQLLCHHVSCFVLLEFTINFGTAKEMSYILDVWVYFKIWKGDAKTVHLFIFGQQYFVHHPRQNWTGEVSSISSIFHSVKMHRVLSKKALGVFSLTQLFTPSHYALFCVTVHAFISSSSRFSSSSSSSSWQQSLEQKVSMTVHTTLMPMTKPTKTTMVIQRLLPMKMDWKTGEA